MNGEILTPASPRWVDFMVILTSPAYLDFHLTEKPKVNRGSNYHFKDGMAWYCLHHCDDEYLAKGKPIAHEALRELVGVDVAATLAQWPDLCDCDLVFKLGNEEEE